MEHYIEFLQEEFLTQENNTVKKRGNAVIKLFMNALKSLFNYLTKETENEHGESYFYRNVMSKIFIAHEKRDGQRPPAEDQLRQLKRA